MGKVRHRALPESSISHFLPSLLYSPPSYSYYVTFRRKNTLIQTENIVQPIKANLLIFGDVIIHCSQNVGLGSIVWLQNLRMY